MYKYEYVSKEEYGPEKQNVIAMIKAAQAEVRKKFTFSYIFIGSTKRNMITCDYSQNVGYDFDVDIYVNDEDEEFEPGEIKHILMDGFNKIASKYGYGYCQDSTRVFTNKRINQSKAKVTHSVDFAIVHQGDEGEQYIRNNKKQKTYTWEPSGKSQPEIEERADKLKKDNHWDEVRDKYLHKKNTNNDLNKKSRSLYKETINDLHKKYYDL